MEHRRERGLKKLPDGRWQFSWCHGGHYYRRIAPSKTEARAYLEKIHTQIREGRYLDKKKEAKTTFEQAVEKFLEWSHANTRPRSHANDKLNAPLWLASPHFKGKKLDKITAGDIEQFRLDRLKGIYTRGPSINGLMDLAGRLYVRNSGRTLKHERRAEVRSVLLGLLSEYSRFQLKRAVEDVFAQEGGPDLSNLRIVMRAALQRPVSKPGRPITKRTVDISIARLKRMFSLCVDWDLCARNPATKVKLFREDEKRTRYLTPEEEERLLKACSPPLAQVVTFALHTGLRRGEILGLRPQDVDFQNAVLTIPATKAKGRRDRYVPLNSVALQILKKLPRPISRSAPFFANSVGKEDGNLERAWRAALEESELEDFRFHDLRHTFASRLVMGGVDLAVLRELLGHRDFEMTLRYAHLAPSHLRSAVKILEPNQQKTNNCHLPHPTHLGSRGA